MLQIAMYLRVQLIQLELLFHLRYLSSSFQQDHAVHHHNFLLLLHLVHYLQSLMKDKKIGNNLLFVAVAYNSGPGSLYRLKQKMKYNDDPLLFIESIPFRETRGFVERIMANYWIYRTLMNQPVLSMDNLIEGRWPEYVAWDDLN